MATFLYKALTQDGREVSGSLEQPGEQAVLHYLESQGFIPLDIRQQQAGDSSRLPVIATRKFRKFSIIDFTNALAMLLRAGMPVDRSLSSLIAASSDKNSRLLLEQLQREIREGSTLSGALARFENLFGGLYLSLVQAGEVSGNLDTAMSRLSEYLEAQSALRERVVNAMIYPIILLIVTFLSIIILMVVVLPKFKQLFEDMGGQLPAVTKAFLGISDFLQTHGSMLAFAILCLVPIAYYLKGHESYCRIIDRLALHLPWIGNLLRKIQIARYAETLAMMMKCGIPIQKSLETSLQVVSNSSIRESLRAATERLKEGASFSATIGAHFPILSQQMVVIGEQAGDLDNTLSNIAQVSQHQVNRDILRAVGIFEPLIIVTLGIIVAAVIGSIMVAVLAMNDLISI